MRETRVAQASIFENYSEHEFGRRLELMSNLLDKYPEILPLIAKDLVGNASMSGGRTGLSVESIFRCLLLKQQLRVSYEQLAFHLSDSVTYRTFARLPNHLSPRRSTLQSTIRQITPATLEKVQLTLSKKWVEDGTISTDKLRIDSTVVASDIAPPSDSQILNDGVRVLSRMLAKSKSITGTKIRFVDQRGRSKSLAYRIFNAKSTKKEGLYPDLLRIVSIVIAQVDRGIGLVNQLNTVTETQKKWVAKLTHFKTLTRRVVDQTERRIIHNEKVPSAEKIVSLFEEHTDIIVKGFRDVQYGHKINLSSEQNGFITYLCIEDGNPSDKDLFMPVLNFHQSTLKTLPDSVVADGGYASRKNVEEGRSLGVKRVVFHKPVGLSLHAMGVKQKTFDALRNFRAGVEGNISELKRSFGAGKAKWKGLDGFKAFVWSAVLSYNLMHLVRQSSR